jgi:hypothetical protein
MIQSRALSDPLVINSTTPLEIPLLLETECSCACQEIVRLSGDWELRSEEHSFYTLGAASYLDATEGRFSQYQEKSHSLNLLLYQRFGWLYQRVADAVSAAVGTPCHYDQRLALPGFHIFLGNAPSRIVASRHWDLQSKHIRWLSQEEVNCARQISFTLALILPESGSGLHIWNIRESIITGLSLEERRNYMEQNKKPEYHPYKGGHLVIHDGAFLHQIAQRGRLQSSDRRITMQGHGISGEAGYILYW